MGLENFGVDTAQIKVTKHKRVFHAWVEEWEEELLKKNDVVAEAKLLDKYKDLVFIDPDNKCI